jgi:opacity protein-like surface antigen
MKKTLLLLALFSMLFAQAYAADAPDVALVKQGNQFYKQGDLDRAIECFKKASRVNPENFFAWMNCGYAYAAKGDNKTALTYLEKAYSLQPEAELKSGIDRLKRLDKKEYFKSDSPLKFNKKIGLNISGLSGGAASYDLKTGLNAGLEVIYGFGELLSVQGGLAYSQKGGKVKGADYYVNLEYVEIPAMVKLSFCPIQELMTGAYFGGSAGVRISGFHKINGVNIYGFGADYELFDVALLGGIDATYPVLGLFWINADLRFSQGMLDVLKSDAAKITNPVFTASFGIIF